MVGRKNIPNTNKNFLWSSILFLLWPGLSFLYSLKHFNLSTSKVVFVLFYGLFGYTFIYNEQSDSSRHISYFNNTLTRPFTDLFLVISSKLTGNDSELDFFLDILNYVLSRFTDSPRVFFCTLSMLIGWILIKNLGINYKIYCQNKNIISLIFFIMMIVLIPPSRIVSFRHYFAMLVFIYGLYNYYLQGNAVYILIASLSIFIHFAFIIAVGLVILHKFLGNKNAIYYVLIFFSFIFFEQAASLIRVYGLELEIGTEAVRGYTNENYLEYVSELQSNRISILNNYMRYTTLFLMASLMILKLKEKTFDAISEKLYSFSLLFFAFVNFTQGLESISNRFSIVLQFICCIFFIRAYALNNINKNLIFIFCSILVVTFNAIIQIRITIEFAGILLITPFAPLAAFFESKDTILELIK